MLKNSISHDLKDPAVTISLMAQRILKSGTDLIEKDREYIHSIVKISNEMISLIEKVHNYILVQEKKTDLENVRISEVYQELRKHFSSMLESRKIDWVESGCSKEVHVDKSAIVRALRNLVSNSIEHGGQGLSRIEVGCTDFDGFDVFYVKDNGAGLNENCREEVFQPFEQGTASCKKKGLGLGLSIVKKTAMMHGGNAWFEPNTEKGVTFHMSVRK